MYLERPVVEDSPKLGPDLVVECRLVLIRPRGGSSRVIPVGGKIWALVVEVRVVFVYNGRVGAEEEDAILARIVEQAAALPQDV